jgi:hypothetical protein
MNVSIYDPATGSYADVSNSSPLPVTVKATPTGASADQVQGTAADGAAAVGNPVQMGGVDGSGNAQAVLLDTNGRLQIAGGSSGIGDGDTNPAVGFPLSGATSGRVVAAAGFLWSGTGFTRAREINTVKAAQANALANGADLTLWTPGAGKKFRLRRVRGRVSAAGRYELRDGTGTVLVYLYLQANEWVTILDMEANGYLSAAANNALLFRNQTGGAIDADVTVAGNEE